MSSSASRAAMAALLAVVAAGTGSRADVGAHAFTDLECIQNRTADRGAVEAACDTGTAEAAAHGSHEVVLSAGVADHDNFYAIGAGASFSTGITMWPAPAPIRANVLFGGHLSASCTGIPSGANSIHSVATDEGNWHAAALDCINGVYTLAPGDLHVSSASVSITPRVSIGATLFELTDDELAELGLELSLEGPSFDLVSGGDVDMAPLAATIAAAIAQLGLPGREILPGVEAGVGFDVALRAETRLRVVVEGSYIFLGVTATANTTFGEASAWSDLAALGAAAAGNPYAADADPRFPPSLVLESFTVPADWIGDETELRVILDDGSEFPVLRETECSDGRDNDGDGLTDFPFDPECPEPFATSESGGETAPPGQEPPDPPAETAAGCALAPSGGALSPAMPACLSLLLLYLAARRRRGRRARHATCSLRTVE